MRDRRNWHHGKCGTEMRDGNAGKCGGKCGTDGTGTIVFSRCGNDLHPPADVSPFSGYDSDSF